MNASKLKEMMIDPQLTSQTITTKSWKLYDNPSYSYQHYHYHYHYHHQHQHHTTTPLYLPPSSASARKLAACLWDLSFIPSIIMDSQLDMARAKIHELKAELEFERKTRKKLEMVNKKLCKQLSEERKRKEAVEDVCQKLAREMATEKGEMDRMKKDIVEERKMLRVAQVLREERVQMKLSEAKILFEEKLSQLQLVSKAATNMEHHHHTTVRIVTSNEHEPSTSTSTSTSTTVIDQNSTTNTSNNNNNHLVFVASALNKRRASTEAENPHIKRGIKGFVEFPRVVRAISSRGRQLGSKVECQKAQLRLLLRHKSPFRSDNLIMG